MNTRVKRSVIAAARANPTEEVCGLIYHTNKTVVAHPCANIAENRAESFEIADTDYITVKGLGRVCGIYHSHPPGTATAFTEDDLEVANEWGLPFYLYIVETDQWLAYTPATYCVPLTGRDFVWGEEDCLSTIRHYYRQTLGVHLTDYDRDETFGQSSPRAILDHIAAEGFTNLGPDISLVQPHDVLLFESDGRHYPHHLAVCLGQSRMLHHPINHLSRIDDIGGKWLKELAGVLRYTRPLPAL